jgi:TorA maturation chaperone TorD
LNDSTAPHAADLDRGVQARLAEVARSRAAIYRALAIGFSEPDDDLRDALAAGGTVGSRAPGPLLDTLNAAVAWLGADAVLYDPGLRTLEAAGHELPPLHELAAEFARLFTGPGPAAVNRFASQYLDDPRLDGRPRLHGPATEAVEAAYEAEGLTLRSELREPGDDIASELEFLSWLCSREAWHWTEGRTEEALRLRACSAMFLREHCAGWWPTFAEASLAEARVDVYRSFAQLLASHLAIELGYPRAAPPDMG